jgi:hypothetical protein
MISFVQVPKEIDPWFGPSIYRCSVQALFGALEQAKASKIGTALRKGRVELFCADTD